MGTHRATELKTLAYGGSKVGLPLVRKALGLLPHVGFVNAYGLTETSSTIAVLTPDDHWETHGHADETVAKRLGSVGRPLPGIEVQIRSETGGVLGAGETGELFVRGDQVSGKYTGLGSALDENGWFPTRDLALLDEEGYLFIIGRSDDTIIRGGENIAPAELEDVLVEHRTSTRWQSSVSRTPSGGRPSLQWWSRPPESNPTPTSCGNSCAGRSGVRGPRTMWCSVRKYRRIPPVRCCGARSLKNSAASME